MFDKRSSKRELMDDLALDHPALAENLRELEGINRWLGGKRTLISALDQVYRRYARSREMRRIAIADLGCGGGDLLRAIHDWAQRRELDFHLTGIDANPFMVRYAVERSHGSERIGFETADVLTPAFEGRAFDIVCLNTFCHHLGDAELVRLFGQLKKQTSTAIIVNDLHRHWFAYLSIKGLSRLLNFSYLARHDGPLSVLRAFTKRELIDVLRSANIDRYQIRWRWAFRWELIVWIK